MFSNVYKNKKVLITGNTGFKGSWLTFWLRSLGADIIGVSKDIPTSPSLFEVTQLNDYISFFDKDIRNLDDVIELISKSQPDFIFHLAAQAIVSSSYENPINTITSNVIGTVNILEALRIVNPKAKVVIITSDKAYDNIEQVWGYRENDILGGKDVYSGSKGAAEILIKSYFNSFFKTENINFRFAIARAGNVIGGGDWAKDRIVVDSITSWSEGKSVLIRSPNSTRPWQHVLEPLSGYLLLGMKLDLDYQINGEAYNFGPRSEQNRTVLELIKDLSKFWAEDFENDLFEVTESQNFHEAGLLKLNCDKALHQLAWVPVMDYETTIQYTGEWYKKFYLGENMVNFTNYQIQSYEKLASKRSLIWTV